MTDDTMKVLGERMRDAVKSYVARSLSVVAAKLETMERSIAAIPPGEKGEPGPTGEPGEKGIDGVDGQDGKDGLPGAPGKDGTNGLPGKDGADGRDGVDGKEGSAGAPGKDGADGLPGKDGAPGRDGVDGKEGSAGAPGKDGVLGLPGKDGAPGRDGRDGRDGADGFDGAPGRDALELEILPALDAAKNYARGTYVEHRGGLMRAVRNTDALKDGVDQLDALARCGWHFVVAGINSVGFEVVDERSFKLAVRLSDGKTFEHVMESPALVYRGVWKQAKYRRGDTVSYGNSMWHCERPTEATPGESKDWILAVRKGVDGKDGKPGKDGERGPDGRPGLDLRLRPGL